MELYFTPATGLGWSSASNDGQVCVRIEPRGLFKDDPHEGKRWFWWNVLAKGVKVAYGQAATHKDAVAAAIAAAQVKGVSLAKLPQAALY